MKTIGIGILLLLQVACVSASFEQAQRTAEVDAYIQGMQDAQLSEDDRVLESQGLENFIKGSEAGKQEVLDNVNKYVTCEGQDAE